MATPLFFSTQEEFRKWLQAHHNSENELVVGFYKVHTDKPSMSWSQSVDQALCYGWIDGVKHSIDSESYQIRFTPRKRSSIWSAVNIKKVEDLIAKGLMHESGMLSFQHRSESKSRIYSFENEEVEFSPHFKTIFMANDVAWSFFQALAPTYRKTSSHWVMSAKQESTREKRLHELIADCEKETNKWRDNPYKKSNKQKVARTKKEE